MIKTYLVATIAGLLWLNSIVSLVQAQTNRVVVVDRVILTNSSPSYFKNRSLAPALPVGEALPQSPLAKTNFLRR